MNSTRWLAFYYDTGYVSGDVAQLQANISAVSTVEVGWAEL